MNYVDQNKEQFGKVIEHFKSEISNLRTGRATPAIVEDVRVEAYGTKQPLKSLASISVADAKTINVEPWDKSVLQNIENSIRNSDLGLSPVNDGKLIRLILPDLTTERRQELIKVLHQKLEQAKITIRKTREDIRSQIEKAEKDKVISEDDKFKQFDALEKVVKEYNDKMNEMGGEKEKEINTV